MERLVKGQTASGDEAGGPSMKDDGNTRSVWQSQQTVDVSRHGSNVGCIPSSQQKADVYRALRQWGHRKSLAVFGARASLAEPRGLGVYP